LDWPTNVVLSSESRQRELHEHMGRTFSLETPLGSHEAYEVAFDPSIISLGRDEDPALYLAIPDQGSEVQKLVAGWRSSHADSDSVIEQMKQFFQNNKFTYTLSPSHSSSIADFLFHQRTGFCEHFAAAAATLLRSVEIPARVIVGYQGGSSSLMGDYVIVYQRDAHAWVEYWDKRRKSWKRLDPTGWIAQERLALGGESYIDEKFGLGIGRLDGRFSRRMQRWAAQARLLFDQTEIFWVTFLLRFDFTYQQTIFAQWGWADLSRWSLGLLALGAAALTLFGMTWLWYRKGHIQLPAELLLYRELCSRLAQGGLQRGPSEGPLALARRAMARWPQQARELQSMFSRLTEARYGRNPMDPTAVGRMRYQMRHLHLAASQGDSED
jgi:protein-glutamine gamma-glutamyltransferase